MEPEDFIENAVKPEAWLRKAIALRTSADSVWETFSKSLIQVVESRNKGNDKASFREAYDVLYVSQFLYALCAECALKGLIIKRNPEKVLLTATMDGTGKMIGASFDKSGIAPGDGHNLEALAEVAGILKRNDRAKIRELLRFASNSIRWKGRYPVPLKNDSVFIESGAVPLVGFVHYFCDYMDPFLDELFLELAGKEIAWPRVLNGDLLFTSIATMKKRDRKSNSNQT